MRTGCRQRSLSSNANLWEPGLPEFQRAGAHSSIILGGLGPMAEGGGVSRVSCAFRLQRLGPTPGFGLGALPCGLQVIWSLRVGGLGPMWPVLNNVGPEQASLVPVPGSLKPQYYFPGDWMLSQES